MQTGKTILSAAALVVTAVSTFAVKTYNKFGIGHPLFVQVTDGSGVNVACATCRSVRTKAVNGVCISSCATVVSGNKVHARNRCTYFTARTKAKVNCVTPWTKATQSL